MPDLDDIVTAIESGDLDGNLDDIGTAIVNRVRTGEVQMAWRLRYDGDEWTQESVTLGELKFAEQHAHILDVSTGRPIRRNVTMWELDPRGNAEHAVALLVAHLHKAQGVALDDALKRAESITGAELVHIIGEYELVSPPKGDGTSGPSISMSTTA